MALLFVVMIRNMMAVNWSTDHFLEMIPDLVRGERGIFDLI